MKLIQWCLAICLLVPSSALANPYDNVQGAEPCVFSIEPLPLCEGDVDLAAGYGCVGHASTSVHAVESLVTAWRPDSTAFTPFEPAASSSASCNFDSDCKVKGVVCRKNRCSNAPDGECWFDSECGGDGKRCSSGKCK